MINPQKFILFLAVSVTLIGCSTANTELTEEQIAISERLYEKFSDQSVLVYDKDTLLAGEEVLNYYHERDFAPVWIAEDSLNESGSEMFLLVKNARDHGLLPEMFAYPLLKSAKDTSLLDAEMLLSNAFYLMISHLSKGCIDTSDFSYTWKKDQLDFSISDELDKVFNGEKPTTVITDKQPKHWEYQQLQLGLASFLDSAKLDTNHYHIPKFKDDSVQCYEVTKQALIGHGFLDSTEADNDSIFLEHLRQFQRLNGLLDDALVGRWTGRALEYSNTDRFLQAALSLEKWRWKPDTLPEKYIRVNVPEFQLYFVDSTVLKRKHRVIVGAPVTPTPEFSATMRRMITNPIWHVPYSISSTEILYAARRDSSYFSKRNYKIYKGGVEQDPTTVDWSKIRENNFPYRVQQGSGSGNSLGRLKFMFPNSNYVFIHDTPSKYLFKNDVRAYSHGCIRLEKPFELGKELLFVEKHEIAPDSLDSIIARGTNRPIELHEPFPVFIEYYTATADSSGRTTFHPDIYGRDEKYLKNSFRKFLD